MNTLRSSLLVSSYYLLTTRSDVVTIDVIRLGYISLRFKQTFQMIFSHLVWSLTSLLRDVSLQLILSEIIH